MTKIKSFNIFINEKLGVLTGLDEMARAIIDELSNKNYFKYKTKYLDKNITINCFKTNCENKRIFFFYYGTSCL